MPRKRIYPKVGREAITLEDRTVPAAVDVFAVGAGVGGGPQVNILNATTGAIIRTFNAFDSAFRGGVRVATGDFTQDGVPDIVAAAGVGGAPHVKLFDGRTGELLSSFFAYNMKFTGGVYVAVGDVTGDARPEIVTAAGEGGGPHVKVFDARGNQLASFFSFDRSFRGGATVAIGDVTGNGLGNIISAAGPGGSPGVRVFDGTGTTRILGFTPYSPAFRGGVMVAAADLNDDGRVEIVVGAGVGGGPHVKVYDGTTGALRGEFNALPVETRCGVCLSMQDVDGDGVAEILVGASVGEQSTCRVFDATTFEMKVDTLAFDPRFLGGANVAGEVRAPIAEANHDVVLTWNDLALQAIRADRTAPPRASRALAMLHAAVYDAVNAVLPVHDFYRGNPSLQPNADASAAAASAARDILAALFPAQVATFDAALATSLAGIADGQAETDGVALGSSVAAAMLTWRSTDGSSATVSYTPGTDPGDWQPTPAAFAPALLPQWPNVSPFAMTSGDQFRPTGAPALTSAEYAAALNEVQSLGSATSTTRTADQTNIALFWADGAGTMTPPGHWNQIAQTASLRRGLSLAENARLFALLNMATADAAIASWDAKYAFDVWRPVTAIRGADTDGNAATTADPSWTPLIATPPFPSYTSGHSTFSGAASAVLAAYFRDEFRFTDSGDPAQSIVRSFTSFSQAADEAGWSRIYGGIHYSFDNVDGLAAGRAIGEYVVANHLK